jgi:hypothetical protein
MTEEQEQIHKQPSRTYSECEFQKAVEDAYREGFDDALKLRAEQVRKGEVCGLCGKPYVECRC